MFLVRLAGDETAEHYSRNSWLLTRQEIAGEVFLPALLLHEVGQGLVAYGGCGEPDGSNVQPLPRCSTMQQVQDAQLSNTSPQAVTCSSAVELTTSRPSKIVMRHNPAMSGEDHA